MCIYLMNMSLQELYLTVRAYVVGSVLFLQEEGAQSVTGCDAGSLQERVVSAGCHTIRQTYTQEVWTET